MAKSKKKPKKPKPRIKVAPPSKRHKSVKDYDRKSLGKELKEALENVAEQERTGLKPIEFKDHQVHAGSSLASFLNEEETEDKPKQQVKEPQKSWVYYFFAIFGFKRKT